MRTVHQQQHDSLKSAIYELQKRVIMLAFLNVAWMVATVLHILGVIP